MIGGVVVLGLVGAGPECKEEHFDDDLVHGHIVAIVLAHESDVGGLDVEPAGFTHGDVEL